MTRGPREPLGDENILHLHLAIRGYVPKCNSSSCTLKICTEWDMHIRAQRRKVSTVLFIKAKEKKLMEKEMIHFSRYKYKTTMWDITVL